MTKRPRLGRRLYKERELWVITLFILIWLAVICYYPMYLSLIHI